MRHWGCARFRRTVLEGLTRLGPFGSGNAKPVFRASPVDLVNRAAALKERHLSLLFRQDGRSFRAVAWRAIDKRALSERTPRRA